MSKGKPYLDNSKETANKYIAWLKKLPFVKAVYLGGSRAKGKERKESDWDLTVLAERKLRLPNCEKQFNFYGDVTVITDEKFLQNFYKKM